MRVSLFEQLKQKQLSFLSEIDKMTRLINDDYNLRNRLYESFKVSPYCVHYENYDDIAVALFETVQNYGAYSNNIDALIANSLNINNELTMDSFLNYLELYKTLLNIKSTYSSSVINQIKQIIDYDCKKIGYKFVFDNESNTFKVMLNNPEAESVALEADEQTRDRIYKYLTIRSGSIEDKRNCVFSLYRDVENTVNKLRQNNKDFDKLGQFIQCTRHTEDDPIKQKQFPFYYENEEEWLDKLFDMIIGALAFTKTKEIAEEIRKLENCQK